MCVDNYNPLAGVPERGKYPLPTRSDAMQIDPHPHDQTAHRPVKSTEPLDQTASSIRPAGAFGGDTIAILIDSHVAMFQGVHIRCTLEPA
jgi:hypothetical protein